MTSPRIYTYKITFEEVPHYYYGVHKEKSFDEYYMGTPSTNKMYWELYTPKKEILQFFDYTDEGWLEAQEEEKNLIREVFNSDTFCLNENCGGIVSLQIRRENGRKNGLDLKRKNKGIFGLSEEEKKARSIKGGKKSQELGYTFDNLSKNKLKEISRLSGIKTKEFGIGIHGLTKTQLSQQGKKGDKVNRNNGTGIYGITREKRQQIGKESDKKRKDLGVSIYALTKEQLSDNAKKQNSQKWQCIITGHISNSGGLSNYQNKRGIDTKNRIRIH